jgi:DNA (cytosine-5)-methyltransferase 1
MIIRIGELFCGPGGLGLASKSVKLKDDSGEEYKFEHVWATDIDKDACDTYRNNILKGKKGKVFCEDVRKLDFTKMENIDLLTFGFPCNDFSQVGEQKGINGNYGPLYTYGVKAINTFHPSFFLAENVSGLGSSNEGNAFIQIMSDLHHSGENGYKLYPHLYKFESYGVPQSRHRIIIIGVRSDLDFEFKVPSPNGIKKTSYEAIMNPPIPSDSLNNEHTRHSKDVIERLHHIKPGGNAFNSILPKHLQLNVKGAKISQIYKRLNPNEPSYTVTGNGGGGTHIYHWEENRALTNRERARLQTFPDNFIFSGSKESVRSQIGMAVPVDGAKVIFLSLLKTIAGITYDYIKPSIFFSNED